MGGLNCLFLMFWGTHFARCSPSWSTSLGCPPSRGPSSRASSSTSRSRFDVPKQLNFILGILLIPFSSKISQVLETMCELTLMRVKMWGTMSVKEMLRHWWINVNILTVSWNFIKGFQSNQLTDIDTRRYTQLMRYLVGYGIPMIIITFTLGNQQCPDNH